MFQQYGVNAQAEIVVIGENVADVDPLTIPDAQGNTAVSQIEHRRPNQSTNLAFDDAVAGIGCRNPEGRPAPKALVTHEWMLPKFHAGNDITPIQFASIRD